jgi:hypothetical protein
MRACQVNIDPHYTLLGDRALDATANIGGKQHSMDGHSEDRLALWSGNSALAERSRILRKATNASHVNFTQAGRR